MFFTQKDAEAAAKAIGLDFSAEKFTVDDLLAGIHALDHSDGIFPDTSGYNHAVSFRKIYNDIF